MQTRRRIKVLIVDDMAMVRDILEKGLAMDPMIEVVGSAPDPYVAAEKIPKLKPDVLTLDVEMPRMDGVEFLRRLMPQYPLPVVMVSSLTERGKRVTLDALDAGAVDFVCKPKADMARGLERMMLELRTRVKIASTANVSHWKRGRPRPASTERLASASLAETTNKVIAIGASTGGTEAIREVLSRFPAAMPGVVVVQHMPAGFTKMFAERLNSLCAMEVKEAQDGDHITQGKVLIAPGGLQMSVKRSGGLYLASVKPGDLVNGHRPSVEVLMSSVARSVGANAIGIMLTGMGGDGADGMKEMRIAGARTMAQDEASCVVFGMPKVAWEKGAAERLVPIDKMAEAIVNQLADHQ